VRIDRRNRFEASSGTSAAAGDFVAKNFWLKTARGARLKIIVFALAPRATG
jgi:hypothetical protein